MKLQWLKALGVAAAAMIASGAAQAQDYPTKPVTFITPAAAGNSPDVVTRIVADKLSQMWKQQIVVLNRPGAGGLIAAQAAAASNVEKDGYTLYMTQASTWTVLPIQQEGKMPVDLQKAFAPVGMVGEQPIAVAVNKDVPANSVEGADRARQQEQGRHAVRRHQPRRPGASDRRIVPRPLQGQHLVRSRGGRGGDAQRRDRGTHPDRVRRPGRTGAGAAGRRRAAARRRGAEAPAQPAEPAGDQRNRARRGVERLDRADGAGRRARRDHPEAQRRPAQGRRRCRM